MKLKLSTNSSENMKKLDIKEMKKILLTESKYIIELWKRLPIPVSTLQHLGDQNENGMGNSENRPVKTKYKSLPAFVKGTARAKSLEELHNKFNDLKGKKLVYKERLVRKGLKNRLTKKKKKEERKLKKKLTKVQQFHPKLELKVKPEVKPMKPVYNSEGRMVFSKFDFSESGVPSETAPKKDKDPHKILQRLEKQKEKLKRLESEGEVERAKEFKEKVAWETALKKMEGVKVKDNPELIKKSMMKEAKKKVKSKLKWKDRVQNVNKLMENRQKKRTENIQQRKNQIKAKKMKRAVKKGRVVPGF